MGEVIEIEKGIWFTGSKFFLTQDTRSATGYETHEKARSAMKRSQLAKRVKLPEIAALRRTSERYKRGKLEDCESVEKVALVGHHANGNMRVRCFSKHGGQSSIEQDRSWGEERLYYIRHSEVERLIGEIRSAKAMVKALEEELQKYEIEIVQYGGGSGICGAVSAFTETIEGHLARLKRLKLEVPKALQGFKAPSV